MDKLPADRAGQLKHYMLTMDELSHELTKIVSDINARTTHKLEGWERCGYMVEELRLSPSAPWTPSCEVEPSMAAQIIRTACETGADLVHRRRMSPTEAWDYEEAKPGNRLIKLPCLVHLSDTGHGPGPPHQGGQRLHPDARQGYPGRGADLRGPRGYS